MTSPVITSAVSGGGFRQLLQSPCSTFGSTHVRWHRRIVHTCTNRVVVFSLFLFAVWRFLLPVTLRHEVVIRQSYGVVLRLWRGTITPHHGRLSFGRNGGSATRVQFLDPGVRFRTYDDSSGSAGVRRTCGTVSWPAPFVTCTSSTSGRQIMHAVTHTTLAFALATLSSSIICVTTAPRGCLPRPPTGMSLLRFGTRSTTSYGLFQNLAVR